MDTKKTILTALLLSGLAGAQELPTNDALQHALALTEIEHDDVGARTAMIALAEDATAPLDVRRHAWLHIGRLSRRLGEENAARVVLERAARGDDAIAKRAQAMLDQAPQDPEREKELQARAEVALKEWLGNPQPGATETWKNLTWFGDRAAKLLIRDYEKFRANSNSDSYQRETKTIVSALWRFDSELVGSFLAEQLRSAEVEDRLRALAGLQQDLLIPRTNLAALRVALADPDARVVIAGLTQSRRLTVDDLAPLIADPRSEVRLATLQSVPYWMTWSDLRASIADRNVSARFATALRTPIAATDPQAFRLAVQLLHPIGIHSPEGRAEIVRVLPQTADDSVFVRVPHPMSFDGPNENLVALSSALDERGESRGSRSDDFVGKLIQAYLDQGNWDHDAMATVLSAVRLGYLPSADTVKSWLDRHARDADIEAIAAAVDPVYESGALESWLSARDLPQSVFPILLRTAEARKPTESLSWELLTAMARTQHPDAATWIAELSRETSKAATRQYCLNALGYVQPRHDDAKSRAALRGALLATEGQDQNLAPAIFAQLVRSGDVDVFESLDTLRDVLSVGVFRGDGQSGPRFEVLSGHPVERTPGAYLSASRVEGREIRWLHGYEAGAFAQIWAQLLAPSGDGSWSEDWRFVDELLQHLPADQSGISAELVVVLCEAFAARIPQSSSSADAWMPSVSTLLGPAIREHWSTPDVIAAVTRLRAAALASPVSAVRMFAIDRTPLPLDATSRAELMAALSDYDFNVVQQAWSRLRQGGASVERSTIEAGMKSGGSTVRIFWLGVADSVPDLGVPVARAALLDGDPNVRIAACSSLGASLQLGVVPDLLDALKDRFPHVREAATQALQAIRYYHDEKAHWDRVFAGKAGLSPTSAAEALLDQAKPGNDTETRVLAIRSLGVLGAPETLPFLITWTKDGDATIASAAREAVGQIHAKGR